MRPTAREPRDQDTPTDPAIGRDIAAGLRQFRERNQ